MLLLDPRFGTFLGAFVSEGNMVETGSLKITCKNMDFLQYVIEEIKSIVGEDVASDKKPTKEHLDGDEGYHKYFSTKFGKFLIREFGILPGKRIINDQGMPELIMKMVSESRFNEVKPWLSNYIKMRYFGDGEVRRKRKEIVLTKCKSLNMGEFIKKVEFEYEKGKKINDYSPQVLIYLKSVMKKENNFPKEFIDLQKVFKMVFDIDSKIYPAWIRGIYFDKKRNILIVSAVYRLILSGISNIQKFSSQINLHNSDSNKQKLNQIIMKIAGEGFEPSTFTPH